MSFIARNFLRTNARGFSSHYVKKCQMTNLMTGSVIVSKPSSMTRFYSSVSKQEIRAKQAVGPFTYKAAAVFLGVGAGLLLYFQEEKKKTEKMREEEEAEKAKPKSFGKPKLGGNYTLTNAENGKPFGSEDMKGKFSLIYFGFTHCPDICPEELDKMADVVDRVKKEIGENALVPIFITCDPRRDTANIVKEYVKDFHDELIGLVGDQEEIRKVAKLFRVYVSSPPDISEGDDDYLVDHSIFFYLMDPNGNFLDCYGQNSESEAVSNSFMNYYHDYINNGGQLNRSPTTIKEII